MRMFKSDHRYKFHNQGFHHIIQFRWHNRDDTELFRKIVKELHEQYGPSIEQVWDNERGISYKTYNTNYRHEQVLKGKRRRIYLKNESDATLILLKVQ